MEPRCQACCLEEALPASTCVVAGGCRCTDKTFSCWPPVLCASVAAAANREKFLAAAASAPKNFSQVQVSQDMVVHQPGCCRQANCSGRLCMHACMHVVFMCALIAMPGRVVWGARRGEPASQSARLVGRCRAPDIPMSLLCHYYSKPSP